ncbi:hypothetical protein D3C73_1599360 [compost metagenome]
MKHARINMPKHTVLQSIAIEQLAKLDDKVRQVLGRYRSVFNKGLGSRLPFDVAQ